MNTHLKDHTKEDKFQCTLCDIGFKNQRNFDVHMKDEHSKDDYVANYSCKECLKAYFTKADFCKHMKVHEKNDTILLKCDTCGKEFKKVSHLRTHEMIHNGQRPYACQAPGCHWAFRTSSKLRRHERSHENDRRHQCCQCNKTYMRLEHLREHYDVVHKNQRLACPYDQCEARFTQRPALVTHVKKHREDPTSLGTRVIHIL